jgi:hypothetical protein
MKKSLFTFVLLTITIIGNAQIKGKKSEDPFKASNGAEYRVGDMITLKQGSKDGTFAYAYEAKSALTMANITKAATAVRDMKGGGVSSLRGVSNNIDNISAISNSGVLNSAMAGLMNAAVSEKYVSENALPPAMANTSWEIQNFKVYTDKASGEQIVHAMAKGNGKTIAVLIELALLANEM